MSKLSIEQCHNLTIWDKFVEESPQGTVYSKSVLITSIFPDSKFFIVKNSEEILGGVSLLIGSDKKLINNPVYIQYYNSILFKDNSNLLFHKKIKQELRITEIIINEVTNNYKDFHCINTPSFKDIRPFQWFNYHDKTSGVFDNKVNFTPFLNIKNIDLDILIENLRADRRREYKSDKTKLDIKLSKNVDVLSELHHLTFERQKINRSNAEIKIFDKLVKVSIENNFGELSICEFQGIPIAANLFLYDNKRSYYQFGAQHPDYRKIPGSTKLILHSILNTQKRGLTEVDFVGANSPERSDYKISFNCELKNYYSSSLKS